MRYHSPMDSSTKQTPLCHLGGLTPAQFFKEYWQKKPLLIRQAFPGFTGLLTPNELAGLACEEDAQSRLVTHFRKKWALECGPFDEDRFSSLPEKDWTLLVQGVNHFLPEAADLVQQFNFVPTARLDDLMVSFAPDGGGVGPHFDSYDVFLLQGLGKRLWRISDQQDAELIEGIPLKILQRFETQQEWVLEAGDMLYLPPRYAHWGIALGECMTYSIGFHAPSAQELGTQFLGYLQEKINLQGMYADPDMTPQAHAAEIGESMVAKVADMLNAIRWDREDVARFLGAYLSEPKPHIVFNPPRRISIEKFSARIATQGVRLSLAVQMLFYGGEIFINGEQHFANGRMLVLLRELADSRRLDAMPVASEGLLELLHQWHLAGYIEFDV